MKTFLRALAMSLVLILAASMLLTACGEAPVSTEATTEPATVPTTTVPEDTVPMGVWVEKGDQWGYLELGGEMLIDYRAGVNPRVFDAYGVTAMKEGDAYYYYNTSGEKICEYEGAYSLRADGLYVVYQDDKAGVVDVSGNLVIDFVFDNLGTPSADGLMRANLDEKAGYINLSGEWVIENQFEAAKDFDPCGLAAVKQGGKWGVIDRNGQWVVQPKYDEIDEFSEDGTAIVTLNEKVGFISASGEEIVAPDFDEADPFVGERARIKVGERYGAVTKTGNVEIKPKYDDLVLFSNGAYLYMTTKGWYYADADGKTTAELGDAMVNYSTGEDYVLVFHQSKYGYFSSTGNWVIPREYTGMYMADLKKDLLPAQKDGKWGYLNAEGKWQLEPKYDRAHAFAEVAGWGKLAKVMVDGKFGLINEAGEWVVPPEYDSIFF